MLTKVSNTAHVQSVRQEIKDSLHQNQQKLNYGDELICISFCLLAT